MKIYPFPSISLISMMTTLVLTAYTQQAKSTLYGRLAATPDGSDYQVYYDDAQQITWLTNASLALQYSFGVPDDQIFPDNHTINWQYANQWIAGMNAVNINGYLGFNDWRLPTTIDLGNNGCDFDANGNFTFSGGDCGYNIDTSTSEMSHLYYDTLSNLASYDTAGNPDQPGGGLTNMGPFINIEPTLYWSGTPLIIDSGSSWSFNFGGGLQFPTVNVRHFSVWPVRTGDVAIADGDINLDGNTNLADFLLAQQAILGLSTLTNEQLVHGDLSPLPNGNGKIDTNDLLILIKNIFN